ncbi:MAG: hypothetical protein FJZ92_12120, partial [Chloroflexi bacterium]|nr:hypothetical protein [Chloroflexota bacterium]
MDAAREHRRADAARARRGQRRAAARDGRAHGEDDSGLPPRGGGGVGALDPARAAEGVPRGRSHVPVGATRGSASPAGGNPRLVATSNGEPRVFTRGSTGRPRIITRRGGPPVRDLEGVRVVDLSDDVAGAYAARLLAALGADVVKVEPPEGDPTRRRSPRIGESPDGGVLFAALNAGKRSLVLDPDRADDREALWRLLIGARVVIETGAPGAWRARGVDLDALLEARPATVVCSITPFGQDGPRAAWRVTALTAAAAGGQLALCGELDQPPLKTAGHQAHYQAGLHGFAASLTALFAAQRTGAGERIDISVQEVQAASLEGFGPTALTRGFDSERTGNQARAIWGIYPCADGFVGVASMARQAASVYRCIGHPELVGQPMFTNLLANAEGNELVAALIAEWAGARTAREIFEESQRHRAPFSLIPTPRDLLEWEPLRAAGFWAELDHPVLGRHTLPGLPFTVDGERATLRRAPLLGEHNEALRAELAAGP